MVDMEIVDDAQVAYEAYRNHTGGISLASGQPIPEWSQLRPEIQAAWKASADALRKQIMCPVHHSLDVIGQLDPFDQCVACTRVERNELRSELRRMESL